MSAYSSYTEHREPHRRSSSGAGGQLLEEDRPDGERFERANIGFEERQFWLPGRVTGIAPPVGATNRGFATPAIIHNETNFVREQWQQPSQRKEDVDLTVRISNGIPQSQNTAHTETVYRFR